MWLVGEVGQVHRSESGRVWWDWTGCPGDPRQEHEEEPLVGVTWSRHELLCGKWDLAGIGVRQGGPWGADSVRKEIGCARGRRDVCARGNEFANTRNEGGMIQTAASVRGFSSIIYSQLRTRKRSGRKES